MRVEGIYIFNYKKERNKENICKICSYKYIMCLLIKYIILHKF